MPRRSGLESMKIESFFSSSSARRRPSGHDGERAWHAGCTTPGMSPDELLSDARKEARPATAVLARLGLVAEGVLHLVIGVLAVRAAFGFGGRITDARGAMEILGATSFGGVLLFAIGTGFAAYALWSFFRAVLDVDHRGRSVLAVLSRIGMGGAGIIQVILSVLSFKLLTGHAPHGDAKRALSARVLAHDGGQLLVGGFGLVLMGAAIAQLWTGARGRFRRDLDLSRVRPGTARWITRLGRAGICARAVVLFLIGTFLVRAAVDVNPNDVAGLDGALLELIRSPGGPFAMAAVALGLTAYGVYALLSFRYRRVHIPTKEETRDALRPGGHGSYAFKTR
jgi:hypothetical protein